MDIEIANVDKLKVAELRALLSSHELDTKGTKPILVARLTSYLESLPPKDPNAPVVEAAPVAATEEPMEEEETAPAKAETPAKAPVASPKKEVASPKKEVASPKKEVTKEGETPKAEDATKEGETPKAEGDAKPGEGKRGQKRRREDEPFEIREDEPEIPDDYMCFDWNNSDLTFKINKETFASAEPFHVAAWGFVFSSARATHGFTSGKIAFEAKWTGNLEVKLEDVKEPHEMRVGWSTDCSNLQAGESPLAWAISNFGKKANDSSFEDFEGCTFTTEDVITAMADFSGDKVSFSYAKNGESLGEAFSVPTSQLAGKPLFPHVSCRNVKVEVNFGKNKDGEAKENFFPLLEGYTMAGNCLESAQRSVPRTEKRDECEMIMLIGLPASGKTTWANKHVAENPLKRYNVIGTSVLLERMKVNGEPRKKHMTTKWEQLISKLTKCCQDMLRLASQRRRNFIVDQTNVFANAQKRKVRPFEGMQRKAIVIVPSEEDYKARTEAQEKAECKDVPDNAVMEMKANYTLPEESKKADPEKEGDKDEISPFKEIIFTELQREEAATIVAEYNKDAKEKGFGKKHENQPKRRRGNQHRGMPNMRGGRGQNMRGGQMRGGPRGGHRGMFQRGGFQPRGMMRGGPMRGGQMRGGPMRGGPMRGGPMGGPRGMPFGMGPNRGGNMGPRGGMGGQNRGGNMMGGGQNMNRNMGNMGGRGGQMGGQKFGGGAGGPAPWGAPSPWQQQPQRQQAGGNWGNPWGQQGGQGQQQQQGGWGGQQQQRQQQQGGYGGGYGGGNQGGWNNQGQQQGGGYPGSQNWGGFR